MRYSFAAGTVTNTTGRPIVVKAYLTATSTQPLTQLNNLNASSDIGAAIANGNIVTSSTGAYAAFYGPEGVDSLWVVPVSGGSRTQLVAVHGPLDRANNLSELTTSASTARSALGLGTSSTAASGAYVAAFVASGVATLTTGGTVTVSNASTTANSIILLAYKTVGGTPGAVYISARNAGASFVITSTSSTDTSVIQYYVVAF